MSNTIEIHCDTCKKTYWFGQGRALGRNTNKHVTVFNSERLGDFLYNHAGYILSTTNSDTDGEGVYEYEPKRYDYTQEEWD